MSSGPGGDKPEDIMAWMRQVSGVQSDVAMQNLALSVLYAALRGAVNGHPLATVDREAKHFSEIDNPALAHARDWGTRARAGLDAPEDPAVCNLLTMIPGGRA